LKIFQFWRSDSLCPASILSLSLLQVALAGSNIRRPGLLMEARFLPNGLDPFLFDSDFVSPHVNRLLFSFLFFFFFRPFRHMWLHQMNDSAPSKVKYIEPETKVAFFENRTGTNARYVPYSTTTSKFSAWTPKVASRD